VISLIVNKFKAQEFGPKLLSEVYSNFEDEEKLNLELTVALLSKEVLPIREWEKKFSLLVRDAPGNLIEKVFEFLSCFADSSEIRSLIES